MHHIDVEKARKLMAAEKLDILMAASVHNVYYCTGFYSPIWGEMRDRPRVAVIPRDQGPFVTCSDAEARGYSRSGVFDIFEHPTKAYIRTSGGDDPFARSQKNVKDIPELMAMNARDRVTMAPILLTAKVLKGKGLGGARIGIDKKWVSALDLEEFSRALPASEFVDATEVFSKLRVTKSADEVAFLRRAIEVTEKAMETSTPLIRENASIMDVQRNLVKVMSDEDGAEPRRVKMNLALSPQAGGEGRSSMKSQFMRGQVLKMDIGAKYQEYCADFTRQWVIGDIPQSEKDVYAACVEALHAMVAMAHPGTKCSDMYRRGNDMVKRLDPDYGTRLNMGHSIGLEAREPPGIDPFTDDALEPGMVMCVEVPWYGTYGYNAENQYLITETGHELLNKRIPLDLIMC